MAFFLVGIKNFNSEIKDYKGTVCYCDRCHNQSVKAIKSISTVTLFFIPVLPFYFEKVLKCSICGNEGKIDSGVKKALSDGQRVAIA